MGNGMNKVLPALYLGNFRDAKDTVQLSENKITHILSIHDNSRPLLMDKVYLCIAASDSPTQDISQYFSQCNDFIHSARVNGGSVLVHCLAGVSRSVSVVVAYVMTVTDLGFRDSLNAVRGARQVASPNFGFQRQLLEFQHEKLPQERSRLKGRFPASPFPDTEECRRLMEECAKMFSNNDDRAFNYLSGKPSEVSKEAKGEGGDGDNNTSAAASKIPPVDDDDEEIKQLKKNDIVKSESTNSSSEADDRNRNPRKPDPRLFNCNELKEAIDDEDRTSPLLASHSNKAEHPTAAAESATDADVSLSDTASTSSSIQ